MGTRVIQLLVTILVVLATAPCLAQEKATLTTQDLVTLRKQITACWINPPGKERLSVTVAIRLKRDGTLDGVPEALGEVKGERAQIVLKTAVAAIVECQPFKLPESSYERWKAVEIEFVAPPREIGNWTAVSLKCPAGNQPLEYIQISDNGHKYRLSVWYKGDVAQKTATAFTGATAEKSKEYITTQTIDLLNPKNEHERSYGKLLLQTATAQRQSGCLGTTAEKKKYFEQLKTNAQKIAARR